MFINIYGNDVYVIQLQGNDAVDILDETEKEEECCCCNTLGEVINKEQSDCGFSFVVKAPNIKNCCCETKEPDIVLKIDAIKEFLTKFIDICQGHSCRDCPIRSIIKESGALIDEGSFGCIRFVAENASYIYRNLMGEKGENNE